LPKEVEKIFAAQGIHAIIRIVVFDISGTAHIEVAARTTAMGVARSAKPVRGAANIYPEGIHQELFHTTQVTCFLSEGLERFQSEKFWSFAATWVREKVYLLSCMYGQSQVNGDGADSSSLRSSRLWLRPVVFLGVALMRGRKASNAAVFSQLSRNRGAEKSWSSSHP
jgi:hypothetical protein